MFFLREDKFNRKVKIRYHHLDELLQTVFELFAHLLGAKEYVNSTIAFSSQSITFAPHLTKNADVIRTRN